MRYTPVKFPHKEKLELNTVISGWQQIRKATLQLCLLLQVLSSGVFRQLLVEFGSSRYTPFFLPCLLCKCSGLSVEKPKEVGNQQKELLLKPAASRLLSLHHLAALSSSSSTATCVLVTDLPKNACIHQHLNLFWIFQLSMTCVSIYVNGSCN